MIIKPRFVSKELKLYRCLDLRMNFSEKEAKYYRNLEKGFLGEQIFDIWLKSLSNDFIILNDLIYEINNTVFQIDSLALSSDITYFFEVKNFEGDHYTEADRWYASSGKELKNPMLQLNRGVTLFRTLLQELGFRLTVKPYVVFVNPNFYLYQAPLNLPALFPTQINRFINQMNERAPKLLEKQPTSVEKLLSCCLEESPYKKIPNYSYEQLRKGVSCVSCRSFITNSTNKAFMCNKCGSIEDIATGLLRNIEDFMLLFPDQKMTTNSIYHWCNGVVSMYTVQKVLSNNFKLIGHGRSVHYKKN